MKKRIGILLSALLLLSAFGFTSVSAADKTGTKTDEIMSLLMHMDGSNNSTTFKDETGKNVKAYGDAKISNEQSKFGGTSLYLDGNSDYLTVESSPDFALDGDFTWECWLYLTELPKEYYVIYSGDTTGELSVLLFKDGFKFNGAWTPYTDLDMSCTNTPLLNQWFHFAITRSGSTCYMFINGKLIGTKTITKSYTQGAASIGPIGVDDWHKNTVDFKGYIDELRLIKGKALYTTDFTPPTEPYQYSSTTNKLKVVLEPKEVLQLSVDDDLSENTKLEWTSSDPSVATVDSNGAVTAIKKGNTVITAKSADGTYSDSVNVLVVDDADDYRLAVDLKVGKSCRLTIDDYTNTIPVTWTSMDPTVATISVKGKVTAVGKGLALMTATDSSGNVIGQIYVRVRE
ncbi:LamG-like jellyroll fold domain-containing protein [Anaeromicropila herbilytica]|uniref:BIG2 domain-containing protein n=1 Tax=Anaeromicropila herbilytica TaxID=2785025 RepID=A0A7R7ENA4_9FIRM|nr:LamG-like jellyroll fold domain-containing protein [Anaeromicropila herbilytica]BCN32095.1 hypothetical protein bsdtb5_33900 [Anaeromicropila herbilytica]